MTVAVLKKNEDGVLFGVDTDGKPVAVKLHDSPKNRYPLSLGTQPVNQEAAMFYAIPAWVSLEGGIFTAVGVPPDLPPKAAALLLTVGGPLAMLSYDAENLVKVSAPEVEALASGTLWDEFINLRRMAIEIFDLKERQA